MGENAIVQPTNRAVYCNYTITRGNLMGIICNSIFTRPFAFREVLTNHIRSFTMSVTNEDPIFLTSRWSPIANYRPVIEAAKQRRAGVAMGNADSQVVTESQLMSTPSSKPPSI